MSNFYFNQNIIHTAAIGIIFISHLVIYLEILNHIVYFCFNFSIPQISFKYNWKTFKYHFITETIKKSIQI